MKSDNLLILVDGSSYLFRAYHGLPKLTSRGGEPTGAIKGVISMIQKLTDDYHPSHIAIVFDAPGKTFRHDMYDLYKAHRPPIEVELKVQIEPLLQLIKSMGYPLLQFSGVEADDVIGTLAKNAVDKNMQVLISSGDKDLAQLIDGNTTVLDTMKMTLTDASNVADKFKVDCLNAEQVVDFLALVGDSADNIPGVPKVGPKTAAKWLADYGNVDNLVANADKIVGKVGENLRNNIELLYLSKKLAQIKLDVDLGDVKIEHLSMNSVDTEAFSSLCQRFDLTKLHAAVLGSEQANVASIAMQTTANKPKIIEQYHLITELSAWKDVFAKLANADKLYFEVYANNDLHTKAELVGISFAWELGQACYLPLMYNETSSGINTEINNEINFKTDIVKILDIKDVFSDLLRLFASNAKKITFDAKFAIHLLKRYLIQINNLSDDVMLASYCYQSTASKHQLENIVEKYLQYKITEKEKILGKGVNVTTYQHVNLTNMSQFANERVDFIARTANYLLPRVESTAGINKIYRDIEIPFTLALQQVEVKGIVIDTAALSQQSADITKTIHDLEIQVHDIVGSDFNLNSPKQLQEILFDKLQLPIIKKTPKGQPSTDDEVLQELAEQHELPKLIIENRGLTKLKNTYIDKIPQAVIATTGRIHTLYNQAITSTGRLSSTEPNLQNIPIRTEVGRKIRQAFIAPNGYKIMASDYSQIELRIMAHLSRDELLMRAFSEKKDVHRQTAAEIFAIAESEVTNNQRRHAKAINFGLIYGMSAFGLAKQINVSRSEAARYIETYFTKYPQVKLYMEKVANYAKELGYVETILGRRLYLPDINSTNVMRRNAAERLSINAPMQGTAADIIKIAMINIMQQIENNPNINLIMQVHDELVFEVKNDYIEEAKQLVNDLMQNAVKLSVPLIVDTGFGNNWDEAH